MKSNDEKWEMALKRARVSSRVEPQTEIETAEDKFETAVLRAKARSVLNPGNSEETESKERWESARRKAAVITSQEARQADIRNHVSGSGYRPKTVPRTVPETKPIPGVQTQRAHEPEPTLESTVAETPAEPVETPLTKELEIPGVTTGNESKKPDKPVKITKPIKLEDVVKTAETEQTAAAPKAIEIHKYEGAPPELYEVGTLIENMGMDGQRKSIYRCFLNLISKDPFVIIGPSGAGKTELASYIVDLIKFIDPSLLEEYNKLDLKDLMDNSEDYNGKVLYFTEAQTIIRGSKDYRDLVKAMFGGEEYKDGDKKLNLLFAFSAIAKTNRYWKNHLKNDPEFKTRLNLVYLDGSIDGLLEHRDGSNKRRSGQAKKKPVSITKEQLASFIVSKMMMDIPGEYIDDPSRAFVDQYIPLTFSANRHLNRLEALENTLLKWYNGEDKYEINGKTKFLLGLRNKYRAERLLREDICRAILEYDNEKDLREEGWNDKAIERLKRTIEKSKETVDWQGCWDSYLESLKAANAPPELIAEVINRHVVNGKVTVIDPLTGNDVVLAQYPKPAEDKPDPETVVTDMKGAFDGYEQPQTSGVEETEVKEPAEATEIEGVVEETEVETNLTGKEDVEEPVLQEHKYQFMGNGYDSLEEAACSVVMQKYIQEFEAKEGETVHVSEDLDGTIDFRVNGSFVEYHPTALCKLANGFGDFDSKEDFEVYKRVRDTLSEEKRKEFDRDIKQVLEKNYAMSRSILIDVSPVHHGKEQPVQKRFMIK